MGNDMKRERRKDDMEKIKRLELQALRREKKATKHKPTSAPQFPATFPSTRNMRFGGDSNPCLPNLRNKYIHQLLIGPNLPK